MLRKVEESSSGPELKGLVPYDFVETKNMSTPAAQSSEETSIDSTQPASVETCIQSSRRKSDPAWNHCKLTIEGGKKIQSASVEFVGSKNVVHLVTDNAATYKAAGRLLNDKYPNVYWSPCATHCLNLVLGDIGTMELVASLENRASLITKFVYNHGFLLAWLRKREGSTEIIRSGPTRFATTFIALKSIHQHQHDLQAL